MQTITPYLLYEDVDAALEFLGRAFGFEERLRYTGGEGYVTHAEMTLGDGEIMLGDPGSAYRNPDADARPHVMIHVYVDDVDALCARARHAGAEIVRELADQPYGDRTFASRDPQGHEWHFATRIGDVEPTEWGAVAAS